MLTDVNIVMKKARKAVGLTQAELAEKVGLSSNYISRIETGDRNLTRAMAERLAPVLKVAEETLLAGDEGEGAMIDRQSIQDVAELILYAHIAEHGENLAKDSIPSLAETIAEHVEAYSTIRNKSAIRKAREFLANMRITKTGGC